ncbi:nitroreductase family protein [Mogibacterium neglectum]|uniref:nitroreductase family protein n=1 Tax=Mogibacterium neglectum TaxID=114528 RepID=UPI00272CE2F4|nr:nitroreductase family protein [Mogibacterium neglectum]WLD76961.1 nitroreductase family protein [Mogibacterium neglectum]
MMRFIEVEKMPIDIKKAINERVSTRSFQEKSITDADKTKLMEFNNTLNNPFDVNVKVQYISKEQGADSVKLGTYGTIKGAKDYLAITVNDEPYAMEAIGYQFENLILYATEMGLGTVWLAATFSRKDFEKAMNISDKELFPCICPVGYSREKRSFIEKFTRASLGSKKRKAWSDIFYDGDFTQPLTEADAGKYVEALEMLRLAPSSTNAQPWAVIKEGETFHFFCNYKNSISDDMKKIKHLDVGIALSHFHQTLLSDGLEGKFENIDTEFDVPEEMHYVISFVGSK